MSVHEKIKLARIAKGWTQEDLAEKLGMSINGYGDLERGNRDIKLSKLEQLSELLGVDVSELFGSTSKSIFCLAGSENDQSNWQISHWHVGDTSTKILKLEFEVEKQQLLNAEKDKEIALLKRIIELTEAKATTV
jgi:transcriptional regulator with XRE-family HTH domain